MPLILSLAPMLYTNSDGQYPVTSLTLSQQHHSVGTTDEGGIFGSGTVFKINIDGTGFTVLRSLSAAQYVYSANIYTNSDGAGPRNDPDVVQQHPLQHNGVRWFFRLGDAVQDQHRWPWSFAVLYHFTNSVAYSNACAALTLSGGVLWNDLTATLRASSFLPPTERYLRSIPMVPDTRCSKIFCKAKNRAVFEPPVWLGPVRAPSTERQRRAAVPAMEPYSRSTPMAQVLPYSVFHQLT